jgi:hypothetical protein
MVNVAVRPEGRVARPLNILVTLIREDLKRAEDAGLPYKQAAGEKLREAKAQLKRGEWGPWLQRNFELSQTTAQRYMNFAGDPNSSNGGFSSLNDYHRQTGSSSYRSVVSKQDWHEGVKESIERAKREADRVREENLTRQQEREADQKLALRLIEIGFKILAKELHPDRGGSREAMIRLNRVRDHLKQCV